VVCGEGSDSRCDEVTIRILDEAESDLVGGFHFYEQQDRGLGSYFLDSLYADIESLLLYAGIHEKHFGYFRMLAHRFPFAIYYLIDRDVIEIHAVLDCRRSPLWTRRRLE
jgi:hypothetical protein